MAWHDGQQYSSSSADCQSKGTSYGCSGSSNPQGLGWVTSSNAVGTAAAVMASVQQRRWRQHSSSSSAVAAAVVVVLTKQSQQQGVTLLCRESQF
jgi:hypothetical protein